MMIMAIFLIMDPQDGYLIVMGLLGLSMTVSAIAELYYYFTMARFMVGGKVSLYRGVILLDFAFITGTIDDLPSFFVLLYLVGIHLFTGLVEFLRANEARRYGAKHWRMKLVHGFVDVVIAIACIIYINNQEIAVIIYSLGVIYSGLVRITSSFKKTAIVYIQ
jgi:uncharacterized membrane protein HdeD (DUF308 family)